MLTTFVIALREGVEASLIVGIVAAFLRKQGRPDALRAMWLGVGLAVALCVGVAIALRAVDNQLPNREQEGLETIVALIAVAMVTYMIVWMGRNARGLKAQLQSETSSALAPAARRWRSSSWPSSPCCARASRPPSSCSRRSTTPRIRRRPASAW